MILYFAPIILIAVLNLGFTIIELVLRLSIFTFGKAYLGILIPIFL
jgi:hypothetical protein